MSLSNDGAVMRQDNGQSSVELASPVVSTTSLPGHVYADGPDASTFGTSLQRLRKLQTDYFGSRTPPLSSPSALSSNPHTPLSDYPVTPRPASTSAAASFAGSPSLHWPMPPNRSATGLGFDFGEGDVVKSRPMTPYYLAPEEFDEPATHPFGATPSLGMSLQSQSLVNLSRPINLEQLRHLRQAAFDLEIEARPKPDVLRLPAESKRIRRKAVPSISMDVDSQKVTFSTVQHCLSVAPRPITPIAVLPLETPKRPTLSSIYRNSRASQSVSDLSNRISSLSNRGSSRFATKPLKISDPILIAPSETSSISERSEESQASTSSSFSATFAREAKPSSKPMQRPHVPARQSSLPWHEASVRTSTASEDESSSSEPTPTTPPTTHLPLPEVDSGFKKLGMGLSRGMSSVFNLLGHTDGEERLPVTQHRKVVSLFRRKEAAERRIFSLRLFKKAPVV